MRGWGRTMSKSIQQFNMDTLFMDTMRKLTTVKISPEMASVLNALKGIYGLNTIDDVVKKIVTPYIQSIHDSKLKMDTITTENKSELGSAVPSVIISDSDEKPHKPDSVRDSVRVTSQERIAEIKAKIRDFLTLKKANHSFSAYYVETITTDMPEYTEDELADALISMANNHEIMRTESGSKIYLVGGKY